MRIDIHDQQGRARIRILVDPAHPPSVVRTPEPASTAIALDWNQTTDDRGLLRRCPVCGHEGLYVRRSIPQITWFAAVAGLGLAAILFTYGQVLSTPTLIVLVLLLIADLLIWRFAPRMILCYRCDAHFHQTPVPPGLEPWDPTRAAAAGGTPLDSHRDSHGARR